mgnify:CR=1 FL=1
MSIADKLKQLNSEFNVSQTTRAQLDLILNIITRNVFSDAFTHALDLIDKAFTLST